MSEQKAPMSNLSNEPPVTRPDLMRNRLPQHNPDPPYSAPPVQPPPQQRAPLPQYQPPPQPPLQQPHPQPLQQQQQFPTQMQNQPPPPQMSYAPPPAAPQPQQDARVMSGGGVPAPVPSRAPPPVRQPSQAIDNTILPSGKPVVKEVTITLSGKLPAVPSSVDTNAAPSSDAKREEIGVRPPVTRQTIEHRESQQRIYESRTPDKPVVPQQNHVQPTYREPIPQMPKSRPTELPLQQERPASRSTARTPGSWCSKTGRFIPDPDASQVRVQQPPPEPVFTPTPRRQKQPGGAYCPKTGRYLPPQEVARRAMTPKGDEFRVKFADDDDAEEEPQTPRYLRKERSAVKPNLAFGSVWTPRDNRPKVRRAKSTDWLEQRNAITPRGDGRDRDFAKSVENFGSREGHFTRSSSNRSSLRKPNNQERFTDYSNVTSRVSSFNDHYQPSGGHKKVISAKLQWTAKSKVDSFGKSDNRHSDQRNAADHQIEKKEQDYAIRREVERESYSSGLQQNHHNANEEVKKIPRARLK